MCTKRVQSSKVKVLMEKINLKDSLHFLPSHSEKKLDFLSAANIEQTRCACLASHTASDRCRERRGEELNTK